MGLGFLLFLAGQDIEPASTFATRWLRLTASAYLVSLALAFPVRGGAHRRVVRRRPPAHRARR